MKLENYYLENYCTNLWINTNLFIFIWTPFSLQSHQHSSKLAPHYCFNLHWVCLWMMSKILYLCYTSYSATLFYLSFFHFLLSVFSSGVCFFNLFFNWRNLEPVRQSEVKSEKEKQISYINTYIWNLDKWYWWTCLQGRNGDRDIEQTLLGFL